MAPELVARITPLLARPEVTPLMQVWWRTHLSFWHYINGRYGESTKATTEARAMAERYGLEAYLFEIDHGETSALISKGDYAAAGAQLDEMERRLAPSRRMDWAYFHYLRSMLEQRVGQLAAAVRDAEAALAIGVRDRAADAADAALPRPGRAREARGRGQGRRPGRARSGDRALAEGRAQHVRAYARARRDRLRRRGRQGRGRDDAICRPSSPITGRARRPYSCATVPISRRGCSSSRSSATSSRSTRAR